MDQVKRYNRKSITSISLSILSFAIAAVITIKIPAGLTSTLLLTADAVIGLVAFILGVMSIPEARERKEEGTLLGALGIAMGISVVVFLGFWLFSLFILSAMG